MPDEKKITAPDKPKAKAPRLSREEQIATAIRLRPTGRRPGVAHRRPLPSADATKLTVTAHPRCKRRGIKMFGVHFTCDEEIALEISKLPPGIANQISRHPELVVVEWKNDERLTPIRKQPKPPKRSKAASHLLSEKRAKAIPSPAGTASKKRRGIEDLPAKHRRTEGKHGATNHPAPAEAAEKKTRRPKG